MAVKIKKYRVRWDLKKKIGLVEFHFADGESGSQELDALNFQVVCSLLFNSDGRNPVYYGNGVLGTHEDIGDGD